MYDVENLSQKKGTFLTFFKKRPHSFLVLYAICTLSS